MDKPIYNEQWYRFISPRSLVEIMKRNPLDKLFIDWVAGQGYTIYICSIVDMQFGRVNYGSKKILLNKNLEPKHHDITLLHELVHIAVPLEERFFTPMYSFSEHKKYEDAVDKIAKMHTKDKELMDYIKSRIPIKVQDGNTNT